MKHNITVDDIKEFLIDDNSYYGIRAEDFEYMVGDYCHRSHQLYQDAMYDENDELMYPYCEEGVYKGLYDAGELDGTCAIEIEANRESSIVNALNEVNNYFGDYIYLIKGHEIEIGTDQDEIIIKDAVVVAKFKRS